MTDDTTQRILNLLDNDPTGQIVIVSNPNIPTKQEYNESTGKVTIYTNMYVEQVGEPMDYLDRVNHNKMLEECNNRYGRSYPMLHISKWQRSKYYEHRTLQVINRVIRKGVPQEYYELRRSYL